MRSIPAMLVLSLPFAACGTSGAMLTPSGTVE
jgi:hypothetical protein